jgi:hypothetical protein
MPVDAAQADVQALADQLVDGPAEPVGDLLLAGRGQLGPELAAVGVQLLPGGDHGGDHGHPGDRLEHPDPAVVLEQDHEHDHQRHRQDPRPVLGQPRRRRQPAGGQQPGGGRERHQATPPRTNPSGHVPPKQSNRPAESLILREALETVAEELAVPTPHP